MEASELYLVCISLMSCCSAIDIIFLLVTIYQLLIKKYSVTIRNSFKTLTIITILAYTLCTIGDIIACVLRYKYYLSFNILVSCEAYLAAGKDIIYYYGNVTFFLLIFMRIQTSFQLSKFIMGYLSLLLIISMLSSIAWCGIIFVTANNSDKLATYLLYPWYPLTISDFLLNFSLFILFIHKIKNKDSMEGLEIADDITIMKKESDLIDYNNDKKIILNVMIKHCVLFGIALISNQSWYIVNFAGPVLIKASSLSKGFIREYTARSIENLINIVILWLVLQINNEKYVKVCGCWHECILKYCMKQDPDMIREGFISNEKQRSLMSINISDKIEGHHLIITNQNDMHPVQETHYL
eukprot:5621_1